jgi:hypothetical protein
MVICGQEFEFSLMNANDLDRFEDANERMQRRSAEESEQFRRGGVRLGDHARAQARIAMDCIDEILGAGSSARLGLDENNMAPIYDVIEELGNAFAAEKQRYAAKPAHPMNREQRRAEQKARQRTRTAGRTVETDKIIRMPPKVTIHEDPADAALRLADARVAMDSLRDDPEAMQKLAEYALKLAAGCHD